MDKANGGRLFWDFGDCSSMVLQNLEVIKVHDFPRNLMAEM